MQRVRPGGQRLVEHAVAADALDADAVALQVLVEESPADRLVAERGLPRDQDVPVGRMRPWGAPVLKPGPQCLVAEVSEPLGVARDRDLPDEQVDVVQGEDADRLPPGGVNCGQGDYQPLRGA